MNMHGGRGRGSECRAADCFCFIQGVDCRRTKNHVLDGDSDIHDLQPKFYFLSAAYNLVLCKCFVSWNFYLVHYSIVCMYVAFITFDDQVGSPVQ